MTAWTTKAAALAIAPVFLCLAINTSANPDHTRFPIPDVLKPNVEFWKKIYAVYSENEVVIHDSEHLDIIYEVVHVFKGGPAPVCWPGWKNCPPCHAPHVRRGGGYAPVG